MRIKSSDLSVKAAVPAPRTGLMSDSIFRDRGG